MVRTTYGHVSYNALKEFVHVRSRSLGLLDDGDNGFPVFTVVRGLHLGSMEVSNFLPVARCISMSYSPVERERARPYLESVTNTQNGYSTREDVGIHSRSVHIVDRVGRSRENDSWTRHAQVSQDSWLAKKNGGGGGVADGLTFGLPFQVFDLLRAGEHLAVDVEFTTSSSDEMRVL